MKDLVGLSDPCNCSTRMASGLCNEDPFWTLSGLVIAFVDLLVAYVLLCVSAGVFLPCKFLIFVGTSLPCPCTGLFGFRSGDFCWHRLLIDRPIRNIGCVMGLVKSRFPFGFVCLRENHMGLGVSSVGDGRLGVSCCGACSRGNGSGSDAKGKRTMNQKNKYGIRRRRKAVLEDKKYSNGLNSCGSDLVCASDAVCDGIVRSLDLRGLTECGVPDTRNAESFDPSIWRYLEEGGFDEKGKAVELGSSSDKFAGDNDESLGSAKNEANKCRLLENALEKERVAHAALYLELEKERASAATAADEAMAMILRLQADKASIEIEAKQYQRMIEEKFAYDEEEMDILKEILVKRERDNHFLERELEAYREIDVSSNEELDEGDFGYKKHVSELNPFPKFDNEQEAATTSNHLAKQESSTVLTVSYDLQQSSVNSVKKSSLIDVSLASRGLVEADAFNNNGIEPEDDGEQCKLKDRDDISSQTDAESTVYDIHVIDDKTIVWKENGGEKSGRLSQASSDSGICSCEVQRDCPSKILSAVEPSGAVCNYLETSSMCPDAGRRSKTDREVEWLRERLRTVQEEKEQLNLSTEQGESVNAHLKLVEEIVKQLQEFQYLIETTGKASSQPSSSKVGSDENRGSGASSEPFQTMQVLPQKL